MRMIQAHSKIDRIASWHEGIVGMPITTDVITAVWVSLVEGR